MSDEIQSKDIPYVKKKRLKKNLSQQEAGMVVPADGAQIDDIKIPKKKLKKKKKAANVEDEEFIPQHDALINQDDHYDYFVEDDKPSKKKVVQSVGKIYFDEVLKRIKERKRKSVKITPEECQTYCRQLVERMIAAAAEDVECVKAGKPGLAKLKMLHVITEISKPAWRNWCISEGIAVALASWLSVLPDGSLPNLSVRSKVLEAAIQLPFQSNDLRDNDLGRILVSLWKHPDECDSNKVLIRSIVQKWVRPMLDLATNYSEAHQDMGIEYKDESLVHKRLATVGSRHPQGSGSDNARENNAINQERINSKLTQMYRAIGSRNKAPSKATVVTLGGVL